MKITKDEILHVANLARLELDAESMDKFSTQIATILEYMDKLKEVDTHGVLPTSHAVEPANAFREDVEKEHLENDLALSNAPEKERGNFVVPKVLE